MISWTECWYSIGISESEWLYYIDKLTSPASTALRSPVSARWHSRVQATLLSWNIAGRLHAWASDRILPEARQMRYWHRGRCGRCGHCGHCGSCERRGDSVPHPSTPTTNAVLSLAATPPDFVAILYKDMDVNIQIQYRTAIIFFCLVYLGYIYRKGVIVEIVQEITCVQWNKRSYIYYLTYFLPHLLITHKITKLN